MLEEFLSYIQEDLIVSIDDKMLLAVSGGVDSMVMLQLFRHSSFQFEVAHVDHSTREGASTEDAQFVLEYCRSHGIICHTTQLDYAKLSAGNFQNNARNERYRFFDLILHERNMQFVVTAHHMDDRWETFVTHLNRKAGLTGLTSLRPQSDKRLRPLLQFTKQQILSYAIEQGIPHRHDRSNDEDNYQRNKIRHHIQPAIEAVFPEFVRNVNASINHLQSSSAIIDEMIEILGLVDRGTSTAYTVVDLAQIKAMSNNLNIMHHIMSGKGFTASDSRDILSCHTTGAMFYSTEYEALVDRDKVLLRKRSQVIRNFIKIEKTGQYTLQDGRTVIVGTRHDIQKASNICIVTDLEIGEQIIIRSIEPGDRYYPEHMNGKSKSVKKYLTDHKVSRFDKELVLVVLKEGKLIDVIMPAKSTILDIT